MLAPSSNCFTERLKISLDLATRKQNESGRMDGTSSSSPLVVSSRGSSWTPRESTTVAEGTHREFPPIVLTRGVSSSSDDELPCERTLISSSSYALPDDQIPRMYSQVVDSDVRET